ncbi:MAG: ABC transporter permease [archaeon]
MKAIYIIWLRELKRFFRAKSRVLGSLAMPLFWLAIVGTGLNSSFSFPGIGVDYREFMLPGIVAMILLFGSMFSGLFVIWDKQFGFLKEMLVAPISRTTIMIGRALGGATTAMFQGLLILLISSFLGIHITGIRGILDSLIYMTLISISFVSVGIAFASKMEDPHGFQLIVNFLIMPMFFLSGALFPLSGLPAWLRYLAYFNPMTYGVDALRNTLIGIPGLPLLLDFLVLLGFCIITIGIGSFLFSRAEV